MPVTLSSGSRTAPSPPISVVTTHDQPNRTDKESKDGPVLTQPGSMHMTVKSGFALACLYVCNAPDQHPAGGGAKSKEHGARTSMFTAALLMLYVAALGPKSSSRLARPDVMFSTTLRRPRSSSGRSVCARCAGPRTFTASVAVRSAGVNAKPESLPRFCVRAGAGCQYELRGRSGGTHDRGVVQEVVEPVCADDRFGRLEDGLDARERGRVQR
jgi:hypothetical protein